MFVARDQRVAIRCRTAITMAGEETAKGARLTRPLRQLDNCLILCADGKIAAISTGSAPTIPPGFRLIDLGDACVAPAPVNAHTHLQYSWLRDRLQWGQGFGPWLRSLVPRLLQKLAAVDNFAADAELAHGAEEAFRELAQSGAMLAGDYGASIPGALGAIQSLARASGVELLNFCEWFGFDDSAGGVWPPRCARENPGALNAAPCGHALYSTSATILHKAHAHCRLRGLPFSFHLAESPEETELLTHGTGAIYELYAEKVLPCGWRPPGIAPVRHAERLGLLDSHTLAIHCVRLEKGDIGILADSGVTVCLCPRSNHNLAVGEAPVAAMMAAGVKLCLGTDGLTSNTDLDVRNEALWLLEKLDIPPAAILRMLTVNGASALGYPAKAAWLASGARAAFGVLPACLAQ